jgi:beta-carotene ketolase (CrtO type)
MADLTFDAVVCGGGNKGLMLAMYLAKYAGMSVGIFERRHEIGGGLATEETAAPGFRGNTHATLMLPWYWAPLYRDFPEFWEYGGQYDQYPASTGAIFKDNGKCLTIYSRKSDPTQEKTAKEIAKFSQKDADLWLRAQALAQGDEVQRVQVDNIFQPPEWYALKPECMNRQIAVYPKALEAGFEPDSLLLSSSPIRASREFFDSLEAQYVLCRFIVSGARNPNDPMQGGETMGMIGTLPDIGYARGGTHQIAHACHQILVQNGVKFFTHAEVVKFIIENGVAKGIRLADGSVVNARKVVISAGLSPMQLVEFMGRDVIGEKTARRVDKLSFNNIGNLLWYTFALRQAANYKASSFNPDINKCEWLGLATSADLKHIANECYYANMGKLPPVEEYNPVIWCHSLADPAYAPPGMHSAQCEMQGPQATDMPEKEYLKLKEEFAENLIRVWGDYAPNINWDTIIGVDTNSPLDNLRLKNLAPHGNFSGCDQSVFQRAGNRPCPELANHRTPVKNLFCTGGYWHLGSNASCEAAYNCYKIMATDMGLPKLWEEKGKEEPDSLVEWTRWATKKAREAFKPPA